MSRVPQAALFTKPLNWDIPEDGRRQVIRAYYAAISFMDANVGRLLSALDRLGLTDKTIVIFMSDHGYNLGEHGQWMKQSLFERSARSPLIMAGPGARQGFASRRRVPGCLPHARGTGRRFPAVQSRGSFAGAARQEP
jgi:uncharacterized sulfatase